MEKTRRSNPAIPIYITNPEDITGGDPSGTQDVNIVNADPIEVNIVEGASSTIQPVNDFLEVITTSVPNGYTDGDIVLRTRWFDTSTNPPTVTSTRYFNTTTHTALTTVDTAHFTPLTVTVTNNIATDITQVTEILRANTTNSNYTVNDRVLRTRFYAEDVLINTTYYNATTDEEITSYNASHFSIYTTDVTLGIDGYSEVLTPEDITTIMFPYAVNRMTIYNVTSTAGNILAVEIVGALEPIDGSGLIYIPPNGSYDIDLPRAIIMSITLTNPQESGSIQYIVNTVKSK